MHEQDFGAKIISGVGLDKHWSSSDFLHDLEEHANRRNAIK